MVLTIYLATATTGLSALLLPWVGWTAAALLFVQCVCVLSVVAILESTGTYEKDREVAPLRPGPCPLRPNPRG